MSPGNHSGGPATCFQQPTRLDTGERGPNVAGLRGLAARMRRSAMGVIGAGFRRVCVAVEADPADGPPPPFETSQLYRCLVTCCCPMFACVLGRGNPTPAQQAVIDRQPCCPPSCSNPWWWRGWNPIIWGGGSFCVVYAAYIALIIAMGRTQNAGPPPGRGGAGGLSVPIVPSAAAPKPNLGSGGEAAVAGSQTAAGYSAVGAAELPGGTWRNTCASDRCRLSQEGSLLTCDCTTMVGGSKESSVQLAGCTALENLDGTLVCRSTLPRR